MTLRLERLPQNESIVTDEGKASNYMARLWAKTVEAIELVVNAQGSVLAAITAANAAAAAANAAAVVAQGAADDAQAATDAAALESAIVNSGVTGLTLTATDAGANATITISGHTRLYGDGTSVAVTGAALTAIPYSVTRYIYYDQASRAGGAVTYVASASPVVQSGNRHSVGAVTTPAAAGPPETGRGLFAPGYVEP